MAPEDNAAPAANVTAAPADPDASAACLNCGEPFAEPRPRFCPACGQESNLRPPRLGEFLQQFGGAYFATEGALWRTLKLLLFRPGELTRQYLAGRRKHYVLPLRLYLSVSLVVLLLLRVMASVNIEVPGAIDLRSSETSLVVVDVGAARVGLKGGVFFCDGFPNWFCRRVQRRFDVEPEILAREAEQFGQRFVANVGGAMFLLLPAFALWLQLAYRNRRLRYTEHLVFALHVHAFWFAMLALIITDLPGLSSLAVPAVPVYTLLAMRRVYGGRWWPRLLRAALVSMFYGLTLGLALGGVVLVALLF